MDQGGLKDKPRMADSLAKAKGLAFQGGPAPVATEQELVELVQAYYAKSDKAKHRRKCITNAICPQYGNVRFEQFGYGTFAEFSMRHGLEVYPGQFAQWERRKAPKPVA